MTDDRTPEQVAADNRLDEALQAALVASGTLAPGEIVTDWCAVVAMVDADGNGSLTVVKASEDQAVHSTVGLLRYAEQFITRQGLEPHD